MQYLSIDRFEGNFAVCVDDDENIIKIKRTKIPKKAKEGDVLKVLNGVYEIDDKETKIRKKEMYDLQDELFSKDWLIFSFYN